MRWTDVKRKLLLAILVIATVASVSMAGCLTNNSPATLNNSTTAATPGQAAPQATTNNPAGSAPIDARALGPKLPPGTPVVTAMPRLATNTYVDMPPVGVNPGGTIGIHYRVITMAGTADPGKGASGDMKFFWGNGIVLGTGTVTNGEGTATMSSTGMVAGSTYSIAVNFLGKSQYYPSSTVFQIYVNNPTDQGGSSSGSSATPTPLIIHGSMPINTPSPYYPFHN
jgi:hypothetical protein